MTPEERAHLEEVARQAEALGKGPPVKLQELEALEDALSPGNRGALRAWEALAACRPVGMGPGAIPWTEIEAYYRVLRLPLHPERALRIRLIDDQWLIAQKPKE